MADFTCSVLTAYLFIGDLVFRIGLGWHDGMLSKGELEGFVTVTSWIGFVMSTPCTEGKLA